MRLPLSLKRLKAVNGCQVTDIAYTTDPRATLLLQKAHSLGYYDGHVRLAVEIEAELEKQKGKTLFKCYGAIAAIACALGIPVNVQLVFSSLPEPLAW